MLDHIADLLYHLTSCCAVLTLKVVNLQACLLAAWVKSGMWLSPDVSQVLDIQVLSDQASTVITLPLGHDA